VGVASHRSPSSRRTELRTNGSWPCAGSDGSVDPPRSRRCARRWRIANPAWRRRRPLRSGVSALLDEPGKNDEPANVGPDLEQALALVPDADKPAVIEAIGRAASTTSEAVLAQQLAGAPPIAEAAALALGRFGRRKIEVSPQTRIALAELTASPDPAVRYAAVYVFSREVVPSGTDPIAEQLVDRLTKRVADDVPEIRMLAVTALDRHGAVTRAHRAIEQALLDRDWRVAAVAAGALTGEKGDDAGRDAVAAALARRYGELERGAPAEAHVVLQGLQALEAYGNRPLVITSVTAIATRAAASATLPPLVRGWIECRALAVIVHGAAAPDYGVVQRCGHANLPDHLRLPLLGELIKDKVGPLATRRAALGTLLMHEDARVRAAGIDALASLWDDGEDADHRAAIATLVSAIASPDPIIAGSAIDAAGAVYAKLGAGDPALDAAVLARAAHTTEHELAAAIYELIGKRTLAGGADVCRSGLAGHPVRVKAARACLDAMGEPAPAVAPGPATPPPLDVTIALGGTLRWRLVTTRGEIVIALRPEVAPWAVAAIVTLTRKRYFDGLEVHRVVPGFVVQGGDPTMSGWGGPDFSLPSEPGSLADGPGFVAGGVGMADSGRDSGGSQWFAMHARSPHLDGRYTWVGAIESGQKSADALLIGDVVVKATIEIARP
jgi:cyclophilin family peptidyl-prolyl cis-trans isomerase